MVAARYPTEHAEQVAYMHWLRLFNPIAYSMTTAVPNGGKRAMKTALTLQAEGVKPGYPDVIMDLSCNGWHGLRLEFKRQKAPPSAVSDEQHGWLDRLNAAGYFAVVVRGFDQARQVTETYLRNTP